MKCYTLNGNVIEEWESAQTTLMGWVDITRDGEKNFLMTEEFEENFFETPSKLLEARMNEALDQIAANVTHGAFLQRKYRNIVELQKELHIKEMEEIDYEA